MAANKEAQAFKSFERWVSFQPWPEQVSGLFSVADRRELLGVRGCCDKPSGAE